MEATIAVTAVRFQSTRPRGRTRPVNTETSNVSHCFNPRVLAGGRDAKIYPTIVYGGVSIHASSREDATFIRSKRKPIWCFNPRVLAGGRDLSSADCIAKRIVSIHASSREDATSTSSIPFIKFLFQSTRPRGRTRRRKRSDSDAPDVSIHASSREDATGFFGAFPSSARFNPRVLAGGRDL